MKGVRQTPAMKRGIDLEPEVLQQYSDMCNVNVLPSGFVVHPDASYLGASPDAKIYDPTANPPIGLAEVKCPNVDSIAEVTHVRLFGEGGTFSKREADELQKVLERSSQRTDALKDSLRVDMEALESSSLEQVRGDESFHIFIQERYSTVEWKSSRA
ncbi:hypothetical protein NHX12_028900 [Muraenolepis orangiensis]|uniref:YqaJ viral recombinase domain-containing protein n=1 Tax=Muraenolepis orangiensis TaxID=630683 RepID=A0A9Q0EB45_9TELE|nr:hypothetical protein NHX12_028900 [Muraenolepis orangiensis]